MLARGPLGLRSGTGFTHSLDRSSPRVHRVFGKPMDKKLWQRVQDLHARVLEKAPEERESFLEAACEGDAKLLREVRRLLEGTVPADFMEPPSEVRSAANAPWPEISGLSITRRLGEGGRGAVWLAHDEASDSLVAVKVLSPAAQLSTLQLERFRREGVVAEKLDHPGIVSVLRTGAENGLPFIVMEWVDGLDLAQEISMLRSISPRPSDSKALLASIDASRRIEVCARILREAAEALHFAHEQQIIHRDIKPQNILLAGELQPRLVDFGLARNESADTITVSGEVEGTPNYMSPEQVHARRAIIDRRTDVYSLGVVLYELLTLTRPFEAPTLRQVMDNITSRTPPRARSLNPDIPIDLETICHHAMEKRPEDRYATAAELAADLDRFLSHQSIEARPVPGRVRALRWCQSHKSILALGLFAVIAPVVAFWLSVNQERSRRFAEIGESLRAEVDRPKVTPESRRILEQAQALRSRLGSLPPDLERLRERLRERLSAAAAQVSGEGRAALSRVRTRSPRLSITTPDTSESRANFLEGLERTVEAALLSGGLNATLSQMLIEAASATVVIDMTSDDVDPAGAEVFVQRIDPLTGELASAQLMGTIPLDPQLLSPGHYRFSVWKNGAASAEWKRWLEHPGRTYRLSARLVPDATARDGMISVAGGSVTQAFDVIDANDSAITESIPITLEVAPFWIDESPVTHGEYAAFVNATGAPEPFFWRADGPRPDNWDELPVAGVSLDDARAYAEWRGARLPTLAEWELAVRGPEGHPFPWGKEADERLDAFQLGRPDRFPKPPEKDPLEHLFEWYVANIVAVGTTPAESRGPNGLDQPIGNVWEWVERCSFNRVHGELRESPLSAFRVGIACHLSLEQVRNHGLELRTWAGSYLPQYDTGFRCAKSAGRP